MILTICQCLIILIKKAVKGIFFIDLCYIMNNYSIIYYLLGKKYNLLEIISSSTIYNDYNFSIRLINKLASINNSNNLYLTNKQEIFLIYYAKYFKKNNLVNEFMDLCLSICINILHKDIYSNYILHYVVKNYNYDLIKYITNYKDFSL